MAGHKNGFGTSRQGSRADAAPVRAALWRCALLLALSLATAGVFWRWRGAEAAQQYLAGYLVELGLSVDNVLVFMLIFAGFRVPSDLQRRVLSWGVWGAMIMRGGFLLAGFGLIRRFHAILYVFGAFLLLAGIRLIRRRNQTPDFNPSRSAAARFIRRHLPVSDRYHGHRFFVVENGRRLATLLLIVLLVIEATDLVFALDSLPAVIAVTRSTLVAITSNFFAILGLRSLYFVLREYAPRFVALKTGLAVILAFIGATMLLEPWLAIPTSAKLGFIGGTLIVCLMASRKGAKI